MDNAKEGYFGGLPESLFNLILAFLQNEANGGAQAGPALSTLVSLAKAEHAASKSKAAADLMDLVLKVVAVQNGFQSVQRAQPANLAAALAALKQALDDLAALWSGN